MSAEHHLKIWPGYFDEVAANRKTFEIRLNDRNFQVGDRLFLEEFIPGESRYTGQVVVRRVTYIAAGGAWSVDPMFCVLALGPDAAEAVAHV